MLPFWTGEEAVSTPTNLRMMFTSKWITRGTNLAELENFSLPSCHHEWAGAGRACRNPSCPSDNSQSLLQKETGPLSSPGWPKENTWNLCQKLTILNIVVERASMTWPKLSAITSCITESTQVRRKVELKIHGPRHPSAALSMGLGRGATATGG